MTNDQTALGVGLLTPPERLTLRNAATQTRDLTVRTMTLRAATVNEAERSVEAVIATENVVAVRDLRTWEIIDEVLRMDGAELPDQVSLLNDHRGYGLDGPDFGIEHLYGSVRGLRIENAETVGRLFFADETDEAVERAWRKVRGGHLRAVSAGYRSLEYVDIPAGSTQTIAGRSYTAGKRTLRITTRWDLREVSLTVIGADPATKVRSETGNAPTTTVENVPMKDRLRKYLEAIGLRHEASEQEAQQFQALLSGVRAQVADVLESEQDSETSRLMVRSTLEGLGLNPEDPSQPAANRSDPPPADGLNVLPPGWNPAQLAPPADPPPTDEARIRAEAQTAERTRIARMQELGGDDVPPELVRRAVDEGWDESQASREYLTAIRTARSGSAGSAPAGHSRSHDGDCTRAALGAAMMIRAGLDPVRNHARFIEEAFVPRREGEPTTELERAADAGYQYRDMSLVDICREAIRLDGGRVPHNRGAMIRAAVSGSSLSNIFTTTVGAQLLTGYIETADSTVGWTSEADVANFQTNERAMMGKFGGLTKHIRGGTADHGDTSDSKEEYKIARYSKQFVVDEMDIIDDRFGAINATSPADMGVSAAQLRPDLVYAILLANAALSDTGALFNSTAETTAGGHKNLLQDALDAAGLQAGLVAMAKHRIRGRTLNIKARFIIVPQDLRFTTAVMLKSATRDHDGLEGVYNPLAFEGLTQVTDDRIGAAGVTDPNTGTAYAGAATKWYLTARPGENGAKTIEVGYLRGTGRAPQLRSFVLTQGQWGVGWDINHNIGAKALDYRAMQYSDGTA